MRANELRAAGAPEPPSAGGGAAARLRLLAALTWGALLLIYLLATWRRGAAPAELLIELLGFLHEHPLGALVFIAAYALRPLLLFSAALLTVGAGVLYGTGLGLIVVVLGANAGALLAYALGALLGAGLAGRALAHPRLRGLSRRLQENAFESVLTLRLLFVPFDAVSYLAGATRLRPLPFLLATVVGSLPGTLVFVLFGASLGDLASFSTGTLEGGLPRIDLRLLLASAAVLAVSLGLARAWRGRERRRLEGVEGGDAP